MLTKNEISTLSLSPTKKDFVQIWNELLEVAGKLSERWDPTSTNESDPGIVILKALTGIADKLNYNIDKNTLEAFMPTAAQEDSMRKLCDMLGYNIKYYRSAETSVNIKYYNSDPTQEELAAMKSPGLLLPKFTVITNSDKDVNYFTVNQTPIYISSSTPSVKVKCMEGQIVKCESTADNNVITAEQISENNRFYLPEAQVAENGIFIYNVYGVTINGVVHLEDGTMWEKVDNLNIQAHGTRVFKFGYDSYEGRPYIEFPVDYSALINDGLFIYYTRTSGANGNVSPRTLTQLEIPSSWESVSAESFSVENVFAANTGANIETIQQAYNNFKKTIGTFETLVTCRDYMNKIYTMVDDETGRPLVSNILVTDIRNDLNRAVTICSCDDAGIYYKDTPLIVNTVINETEGTTEYIDGKKITTITRVIQQEQAIDHFDLVLYPFKSYSQIKGNVKDIQEVYDSSFKYSTQSFDAKLLEATNLKTIAHNITSPRTGDVVCINNYLRLNAIISTNSKITTEEGALLIDTIKIALANAFNMRELDFGEEIPFESIVEVIEKADSRIKTVSLNEPDLYTTFSVFEGTDSFGKAIIREYAVASDNWLTEAMADKSGRFEIKKDSNGNYPDGTFNSLKAKKIYNKLAVRNILAGRVPLFKYNDTFKPSFSEGAYRTTKIVPEDVALNAGLEKPTRDNPFTLYTDNTTGNTYTGQLTSVDSLPDGLEESMSTDSGGAATYSLRGRAARASRDTQQTSTYKPKNENNLTYIDENGSEHTASGEVNYIKENVEGKEICSKIIYTKTAAPEAYANNIIAKNPDASDDESNLTEITTSCKIYSDSNDNISEVTLADGEYIKFRAPNFITTKTYPAYVNYHLRLQAKYNEPASPAKAFSLFELLNGDEKAASKWESIYAHFENIGKKKTFTLRQAVYKNPPEEASTGLQIKNPGVDTNETPAALLAKSGIVKLCNDGIPNIEGATSIDPNTFKIVLSNNTLFITNPNTFTNIQDTVNEAISGLEPQDTDWTISYDFEYVPFDNSTLEDWESLVKQKGAELFGYTPAEDAGTVLWRLVEAGDHSAGKFMLENGKLKAFTSSYFGLLDSNTSRLHGVYIAESLGKDAKPNFISNNEEYELRSGEYLFIEYTPSTTTEEGNTKTMEPVKEVHGPGTIIRPSGFTEGIVDSESYSNDHSFIKQVEFTYSTDSSTITRAIGLHSFGVNEQVEIRELSKVSLDKELVANSAPVYIYKNFNNCEPLEGAPSHEDGKRVNNTYTLKDGEYIFYTDQNKTELAYYSTGTEVTLLGTIVLPKFDIIDIATIFDSGLQEIPWYPVSFTGDNSITFQEYQYITLGPGDTLKSLTPKGQQNFVTEEGQHFISGDPQDCIGVTYIPAGAEDKEPVPLPSINTTELSTTELSPAISGWKVNSILELNASPYNAQTLRKTDKVETSITLHKANATTNPDATPVTIKAEDADHPLSFKTNLACQSSNGQVKISDLYSNTDNTKSFELKVFSEEAPKILNTKPGTLIPYTGTKVTETVSSDSSESSTVVSYGDLWKQVPLSELTPIDALVHSTENAEEHVQYDRALKLSVSILPNTYGIFSIYLEYPNSTAATSKTWIELQPGVSKNNFSLFNVSPEEAEAAWETNDSGVSRLILKPGLNCVRVNNTGTIYIKTTKNAENTTKKAGVLYFDELRLVDAAEIEYVHNGKTEYQTTQGLNLTQLGYLDAVDRNIEDKNFPDTFNIFDMRVRKSLKTDYTNTALAKLDKKIESLEETFDSELEELQASAPKLQNIIDFKDALSTELSIIDTNRNDIKGLIQCYNDVCADLEAEIALKEALEKNKNINDLENQLADLLSNINSIEGSKQELLDKLEETRTTVLTNADSFKGLVKEDILDDFLLVAKTDDDELIAKLKQTSIEKIEAHYDEQLELIAKRLAEISTAGDTEATKLAEVIEKLKMQDEDASDVYQSFVKSLESTKENQVSKLADRLSTITNERNSYIGLVDSFGTTEGFTITEKYNELPFYADVIITIWPDYMKSAFILGVDKLYSDVRSIIKATSLATELTLSEKFKASDTITERLALVKQADIGGFTEIFEQAKELSYKKTQGAKRNDLIETLGSLTISSPELATAIANISADTDKDRNAVIHSIIDRLTAESEPSIVEKQQLIKKLLEELESEIALDTKLVSISAGLICPSLLKFDEKHPEAQVDEFYSALKAFVTNARRLLLNCDLDGLIAEQDISIEFLLSLKAALALSKRKDFEEQLVVLLDGVSQESLTENTLLTEDYIAKVFNLLDLINLQRQIDIVKDCKLFKILKKNNLVAAWEYTNGQWMDSSGNYFKYVGKSPDDKWQTSVGEELIVSVRRDIAGNWYYNNKNYNTENKDLIQPKYIDENGTDYWLIGDAWDSIVTITEEYIKQEACKDGKDGKCIRINDEEINTLLNDLLADTGALGKIVIPEYLKGVYDTVKLENQLLEEIRKVDTGRNFYYNVPIESNVALDFIESDPKFNTLMNPAFNYDINNVNNNFVISKLDINYLTDGIKIARSSRIS